MTDLINRSKLHPFHDNPKVLLLLLLLYYDGAWGGFHSAHTSYPHIDFGTDTHGRSLHVHLLTMWRAGVRRIGIISSTVWHTGSTVSPRIIERMGEKINYSACRIRHVSIAGDRELLVVHLFFPSP
jgi:hypothetical protein